jgi:hypothetical protein
MDQDYVECTVDIDDIERRRKALYRAQEQYGERYVTIAQAMLNLTYIEFTDLFIKAEEAYAALDGIKENVYDDLQ